MRLSLQAEPVHERLCPLCFLTASLSLKWSKKGFFKGPGISWAQPVNSLNTPHWVWYPCPWGKVLRSDVPRTLCVCKALVLFCGPVQTMWPPSANWIFLEVSLISSQPVPSTSLHRVTAKRMFVSWRHIAAVRFTQVHWFNGSMYTPSQAWDLLRIMKHTYKSLSQASLKILYFPQRTHVARESRRRNKDKLCSKL